MGESGKETRDQLIAFKIIVFIAIIAIIAFLTCEILNYKTHIREKEIFANLDQTNLMNSWNERDYIQPHGEINKVVFIGFNNLSSRHLNREFSYWFPEEYYSNISNFSYAFCKDLPVDIFGSNFTAEVKSCDNLTTAYIEKDNPFGITYNLSINDSFGKSGLYIVFTVKPKQYYSWFNTRRDLITSIQINNENNDVLVKREILLPLATELQNNKDYESQEYYPENKSVGYLYSYSAGSKNGVRIFDVIYSYPERESILIPTIMAAVVSILITLGLELFWKLISWLKKEINRMYSIKKSMDKKSPISKEEAIVLTMVSLLFAFASVSLSLSLTPLFANQQFLWNLIQVSAVIAGFGLLAFQFEPKEVSFFHTEFRKDLRSVSVWCIICIILSFASMPLLNSPNLTLILLLFIWAALLSFIYGLVLLLSIVIYYPYKLSS